MVQIFGILFFVLFFVVVAKNIVQWIKNEQSPRLTVPAKIVDMCRVTHHHHHPNGHHHHTHSYYVTFEVESGDRMELQVDYDDYSVLVTGQSGKVSFQGTRYLGFERM